MKLKETGELSSLETKPELDNFGLPKINYEKLCINNKYQKLFGQLKKIREELEPLMTFTHNGKIASAKYREEYNKRYLPFKKSSLEKLTPAQQYEFNIYEKVTKFPLNKIDAPIRSIIKHLNLLPITTVDTCSGHLKTDNHKNAIKTPSIFFQLDSIPQDYKEAFRKFKEKFFSDLQKLVQKINKQFSPSGTSLLKFDKFEISWALDFNINTVPINQDWEAVFQMFWQEIWELLAKYEGNTLPPFVFKSEDFVQRFQTG